MRPFTLCLAALGALLALFTLWWAGSGTLLADFGGDNAVYFLTANHYSPYGVAHAAAAEFAANSIYPPLYAWLLAITGGGMSLAAAHRVTALIIVEAGLAVYGLARALGLSQGMAMAVVTLCALARITLLEGLEIHSEHLYLLCWAAAALLLSRQNPTPRVLMGAAVAVAAAYLTRSFGLSLMLSLWLWLLLQRPPRALQIAALSLAPMVLLSLTQHGNARYLHNLIELYQSAGVGLRLAANLAAVPDAWSGVFGTRELAGFPFALPMALAVCALLGLVVRLRQASFDGISVLAYGALMLVWPYPAEYERMCYPLLPFSLIYAVLGVRALLPTVNARLAAALPLLACGAAIAPFVLLVQARLTTPLANEALRPYLRSSAWFEPDPAAAFPTLGYQRALTEALLEIGRAGRLPAGACLVATKPSVAALYSGLLVDGYPPFALDDDALRTQLAQGRCHFLFMMMGASPSFPQFYFPYGRLKPWLDVLAIYPNLLMPAQPAAMLARLRATPRTP